jgi:hypothetical protein
MAAKPYRDPDRGGTTRGRLRVEPWHLARIEDTEFMFLTIPKLTKLSLIRDREKFHQLC